jgi:hypothetical protein
MVTYGFSSPACTYVGENQNLSLISPVQLTYPTTEDSSLTDSILKDCDSTLY